MRRTSWLVLGCVVLAAAAACKKDGAGGGKDWSKVALQPFAGEVDGIKFTVQVPEGMKLTEQEKIRVAWEPAEGDQFKGPRLRISRAFIPPKTVEEAVQDVMPDDTDVIVKQEAIDGGFLVVWHTKKKGLVRAATYQIAEDRALDCTAVLVDDDGIPNFDGAMAWLEQICRSLKLQ